MDNTEFMLMVHELKEINDLLIQGIPRYIETTTQRGVDFGIHLVNHMTMQQHMITKLVEETLINFDQMETLIQKVSPKPSS